MTAATHTRLRGSDIYVEVSNDTPLVTVSVLARGGAAADQIGEEGLHHHIAELALRGAGDRDRSEIDAAFDRLGTGLSVNTARDHIGYSATCLDRNLDDVIALLADVLSRPHFVADEHAKLVRETRSDLEEIRDDDADLASRFFSRFFWPGHSYARAIEGTEESLERIAEIDVGRLSSTHRRALSPSNIVLAVAGKVDASRIEGYADQLLGDRDGDTSNRDAPLPQPPSATRVFLIDKPERGQAQVLIGHPGPRYACDDGPALIAAEAAFGGMFSSRMMQEVRVKRGWSYDTGLHFARARRPSWIRMSLAPAAEVTIDAMALVIELYRRLCEDGLSDGEVDLARRYTIGSLLVSRATASQRVHQTCIARLLGVADDYIDTFPQRLEALTTTDVNAAIEAHMSPDALTIVVVGTASSLASDLERFGPVTVVPYRSY